MSSKRNRSPKMLIVATLLIIIGGVVAFLSMLTLDNEHEQLESPPAVSDQPTLGEKDATVSIIEFGDYKCPACQSWHESIFPKIKANYIDTGDAKFSYVNTLFHGEESYLAGLATESVWNMNPDDYWIYHKEIFVQQSENQHDDGESITPEKLIEIAEAANLDIDYEQLGKDLAERTYHDDVLLDQELVDESNVSLTPTLVINRTILDDPFDYDEITVLIEEALEER